MRSNSAGKCAGQPPTWTGGSRLSRSRTSYPRASSASAVWEPMKPAMPVIRIRIYEELELKTRLASLSRTKACAPSNFQLGWTLDQLVCHPPLLKNNLAAIRFHGYGQLPIILQSLPYGLLVGGVAIRSEERRVGKECRS